MTIKLYDTNPYKTTFHANVVSIEEYKDGYDVVLDQTLFFPEEGGQTCDRGTINDIEVYDVQIKGDVIHHYVKEYIEGSVEGKIDFSYRYSNMQNHTGEHILSGIIHSMYHYNNVGFHLGDNDVTTDYDGILSQEDLQMIEDKVNEVILKNIEVNCFYLKDEDIDYRSKKEIDGDLRIVSIEGVDTCACCAPHVKSTIEVGMFKILKAIKHRGGTRVFFICGHRAFQDYQNKHVQASKISTMLSAPMEDIASYVSHLLEQQNKYKQKISSLEKKILDKELESLQVQEKQIMFVDDMDKSSMQNFFNKLMEYSLNLTALFIKDDTSYRFMIASNDDARIYLNMMKEKFTVRGGGRNTLVQGSVEASYDELMELDFLKK